MDKQKFKDLIDFESLEITLEHLTDYFKENVSELFADLNSNEEAVFDYANGLCDEINEFAPLFDSDYLTEDIARKIHEGIYELKMRIAVSFVFERFGYMFYLIFGKRELKECPYLKKYLPDFKNKIENL